MNKTTNPDLIAAKTRDVNAAADLKELKLAILRKEYVKVSDVEKRQADAFSRVKARLLALPVRATPQLAGQILDQKKVNDILTSYVIEALNELADKGDYTHD